MPDKDTGNENVEPGQVPSNYEEPPEDPAPAPLSAEEQEGDGAQENELGPLYADDDEPDDGDVSAFAKEE
jgi:hypothetical protein